MNNYQVNLYRVKVQIPGSNSWFNAIETGEYVAQTFGEAMKKAESEDLKIRSRQTIGNIYEIKLVENLIAI